MAVNSGQVGVDAVTPSLVYQTPDGVVTCLVVTCNQVNTYFGDSSVTASTGLSLADDSGHTFTLENFQGALYAICASGFTASVSYLAGDLQ